jgi:hypothetical protein
VLVTDIDTQNGERTLEEIRQRGADGAFCEEDLGDERQIEGAVAGSAPMARAYSRTTTSVTTSRGSSLTPMSW